MPGYVPLHLAKIPVLYKPLHHCGIELRVQETWYQVPTWNSTYSSGIPGSLRYMYVYVVFICILPVRYVHTSDMNISYQGLFPVRTRYYELFTRGFGEIRTYG